MVQLVDGDIWTECRIMMESCRYYDIDAVAEWACMKPIAFAEKAQQNRSDNKAGATPASASVHALERRLAEDSPKRKAAGGRKGR